MVSKAKQAEISGLELQLDNFIYRQYNLKYGEVKVMEPDCPLHKTEYQKIKED
jgi:hypothetical protein